MALKMKKREDRGKEISQKVEQKTKAKKKKWKRKDKKFRGPAQEKYSYRQREWRNGRGEIHPNTLFKRILPK